MKYSTHTHIFQPPFHSLYQTFLLKPGFYRGLYFVLDLSFFTILLSVLPFNNPFPFCQPSCGFLYRKCFPFKTISMSQFVVIWLNINSLFSSTFTLLCAQLFSLHFVFHSWHALCVIWDKNAILTLCTGEVLQCLFLYSQDKDSQSLIKWELQWSAAVVSQKLLLSS